MSWKGTTQLSPGWRRTRRAILTRDPMCRICTRRSSVTVDHIVPRSQGGTDNPVNLRGLCQPCHDEKTKRESAAARWSEQHRARRPTRRPPGIP